MTSWRADLVGLLKLACENLEGTGMDLVELAERLDAEEKLKLKYRCFVKSADGQQRKETVRIDKLLDVEPERGTLFVSFAGRDVIFVNVQEAIETLPDDGIYGEAAGH